MQIIFCLLIFSISKFSGHDCKEDSVQSNTSDVENSESYSNGLQNIGETADSNMNESQQQQQQQTRNLRHISQTIKSGNGNGAANTTAPDDNSSNESSDDDDDDDESDGDGGTTTSTSSDENEVYSKTSSKNNNGTDLKRTNQKRTATMLKTPIELSSSKKTRQSSALSIDLSLADTTTDAH